MAELHPMVIQTMNVNELSMNNLLVFIDSVLICTQTKLKMFTSITLNNILCLNVQRGASY